MKSKKIYKYMALKMFFKRSFVYVEYLITFSIFLIIIFYIIYSVNSLRYDILNNIILLKSFINSQKIISYFLLKGNFSFLKSLKKNYTNPVKYINFLENNLEYIGNIYIKGEGNTILLKNTISNSCNKKPCISISYSNNNLIFFYVTNKPIYSNITIYLVKENCKSGIYANISYSSIELNYKISWMNITRTLCRYDLYFYKNGDTFKINVPYSSVLYIEYNYNKNFNIMYNNNSLFLNIGNSFSRYPNYQGVIFREDKNIIYPLFIKIS